MYSTLSFLACCFYVNCQWSPLAVIFQIIIKLGFKQLPLTQPHWEMGHLHCNCSYLFEGHIPLSNFLVVFHGIKYRTSKTSFKFISPIYREIWAFRICTLLLWKKKKPSPSCLLMLCMQMFVQFFFILLCTSLGVCMSFDISHVPIAWPNECPKLHVTKLGLSTVGSMMVLGWAPLYCICSTKPTKIYLESTTIITLSSNMRSFVWAPRILPKDATTSADSIWIYTSCGIPWLHRRTHIA